MALNRQNKEIGQKNDTDKEMKICSLLDKILKDSTNIYVLLLAFEIR